MKFRSDLGVVHLRRLYFIDGLQLRRTFDAGMKWDLRGIGARKLGFCLLGEEIIDELFADIGVRRAGDKHGGIGHQEAAKAVCALIRINKLDWQMLAQPAHDIITIANSARVACSRRRIF